VIGFLGSGSFETGHHLAPAFRQGLAEADYSEGRNVAIEYRWQEGQYARVQSFLADLLTRRPAMGWY
jgi:putative ABC transport system substrate-binding protein